MCVRLHLLFAALSVLPAIADVAAGAPVLGFRETWPGVSIQGWAGSGAIAFTNPGTGGVGGPGDGFLMMTKLAPQGHFGTRSTGAEYVGDWHAAGINELRVWLNDLAGDEAMEIHFSLGNFNNLWQYDVGFIPPVNQWAEFVVDLDDSASFSHIVAIDGKGYTAAIENATIIHLRHDLAPFAQIPDSIFGDLGIDDLLLTEAVVDTPPPPVPGGPLRLARPYPNPSSGPVVFAIESFEPTAIVLQIVDPQGRKIRGLSLPFASAGQRLATWDGLDERGKRARPGHYRARVIGPSGGASRPLVRLR